LVELVRENSPPEPEEFDTWEEYQDAFYDWQFWYENEHLREWPDDVVDWIDEIA